MQKPTVAHIVGRYYGLTENWIHTQIKQLTRYRPLVLTWRTENLHADPGIEHYALLERPKLESLVNRAARRLLGYYPSFLHLIRARRARVVHAHFGQRGYFALPLAKATGLPLVTAFYGYDASKVPLKMPQWQARYRQLFQHGRLFLVEGPYMAKQLRDRGCRGDKITVHHLGVQLDEFPPRTRCVGHGETLRVLVIGRFTEKKGVVYAVDAYARLAGQGVDSQLTIIGDADHDPESRATKKEILKVIDRAELRGSITLAGMQPHDHVKRAYYQHDVLLSPSVQASDGDNEGGAPVTLIEAGAAGMPVVATYHCDIPYVVQDGITGLLAPERDAEALAAHLCSLATHPQQMVVMGHAARRHIEAEYDAKRQGARLEEVYDSIAN